MCEGCHWCKSCGDKKKEERSYYYLTNIILDCGKCHRGFCIQCFIKMAKKYNYRKGKYGYMFSQRCDFCIDPEKYSGDSDEENEYDLTEINLKDFDFTKNEQNAVRRED
jgi:hypothetical protein